MTNAEFSDRMERLADLAIALVRTCNRDKTQINDQLWTKLCELYDEVEEYV